MDAAWWQEGVVYQVYPRSLQDSDGDGTGDLIGITRRLDDLRALGIDAVWLSPIYPSPMTDFGYDVSDYCGIDPLFGEMAEFDALLARTHAFGLKLILDFVPNHTSDQHPWFQASRERSGDKADWYLWRDEPNNWMANFGGSGWTWDERRGQFYYHSFLPTQPDLNWRHPAVKRAMYDALRFWLNKGVDGFRVDVIWMMIKDAEFRDNPPNPAWHPGDRPFEQFLPLYSADRPEVHEVVTEMRAVLDEYPDRVLIGEIYLPIDKLVTYYGRDGDGAQLPFNFHLLLLPHWTAAAIAGLINEYQAALPAGAWPNWVLGNHDRSRVATRVGPAQARVAAMLLLTLRGTP
ncbi:MAG: alpha-amylase, partial [Alphaproteobacteria bacterium]